MTRTGIAWVWAHRRLRIALLAVLIAMPLLGGGWIWLRQSSLTAVEHVQVRGLATVHGADRGAIESARSGAARGMSTLDVRPAALRAAVALYPIVRSIRTQASFPHGLRIEVVERPPVAALVLGSGVRTAVAADGVVLGAGFLSGLLPSVNVGKATPAATGERVRGATLLASLTVLGAAPARLAHTVTRVYSGSKGVTVVLRGGLLAYFGDATRPHAKWLSLARVLADSSSTGAVYVDVRLPERPAAGFAPGTAPPDASSTEVGEAGGADPSTAAELAAGLGAAVGGGSSGSGTSSTAGEEASTSGEAAPAGSTGSGSAQSGSTQVEAGVGGSTAGTPSGSSPGSESGASESPESLAAGGTPGG